MTTLSFVSAEEALACITRGTRVFVGSGCAEPTLLVAALAAREDVADVEVLHIMTIGDAPYARAMSDRRFRHNAFFIGANVRQAVAACAADYTPVFLSEIPRLFRSHRLRVDVALIVTTPPDEHGFVSLGVSVDIVRTAVECARVVIAEVNPNMPRTHGDSFIPVGLIHRFVESHGPLLELPAAPPSPTSSAIGRYCASLVPDGATLQLGIGEIPNAVAASLTHKRDLGLHTEMMSDNVLDLIDSGALTCARKTLLPGKAVTSFCMGTRRLYDRVANNPFFEFRSTEFVNDPFVIAQNEKLVAINSALEVDLTGQVCADSVGSHFYSGVGGQVDFIRGAARSVGGRSIIALPSTAKSGTISRIVPALTEGAGVVTTRADVDTIVTEYGIAELKGRTVRERALALISLAHPDFRADLLAAAKARHFVTMDQIEWPENQRPYPVEYVSDTRFGDLNVHFRPLRPSDERLLRDFFYSHSAETVYYRYHSRLKSLSPQQVQQFCTLDYDTQMALAGFVTDGEAERMVAVGRYFVDPPPATSAEVAFTVHDELQGRGIGRYLLGRLAAIARERSIDTFIAHVLPTNTRMLNVFQHAGLAVESRLDQRLDTITLRLT
ncbi:MAG: GNAT family N-acetyltransferase [Candidatus Binatia bacterium]